MPSATTSCTLARAAVLLAVLSTTVVTTVVSQSTDLMSSPETDSDHRAVRVGDCLLTCRWSTRLCRLCKIAIKWPGQKWPGLFPTSAPTDESTTPDGEGDLPGTITFPDTLPEGTQDAMLETASHILSIVSREDSERIRTWLENPERNSDNLDRLAGKLSSFPRAPYGRAYWRLVLRSSRDRPFTLLREALTLRTAYQMSGSGSGSGSNTNPSSTPAGEGTSGASEASSEGSSTEAGGASSSEEAGGGRLRGFSTEAPWAS